jgi:putative membrane protein
MIRILPATIAACLLASTAATAQAPASNRTAAATPSQAPTRALPYVAKAGAGDLYEIQSSQLAATRASSDRVKSFAAMMIEQHTMTTREVTAAARAAGLAPPPPALEPHQTQMIRQLRDASGAAFDRAYLTQQRNAHAMALKLHQTYADKGDTPQLKAVAAKAVPIVQRHIEALQGM